MGNLKGKTAVITGAGSGIGRALAIHLGKQGVDLALNDFNEKTLAETIEMVKKEGVNISSHHFDVSKKENLIAFPEEVLKHHDAVDILINNAGVALGKITFLDVKMEDFEWLMNINLYGVVYGTKAFLPHLLSRPEASIVNISSLFGIIGVREQVPYCTSKFAVRGFNEALRMELINTNVCVTSVHPGGIDTNIVNNGKFYDESQKADMSTRFKAIARTSPEEAAKVIVNGIKNKKHRVLIGRDAEILDGLARLSPVNYSGLIQRLSKSVLKI